MTETRAWTDAWLRARTNALRAYELSMRTGLQPEPDRLYPVLLTMDGSNAMWAAKVDKTVYDQIIAMAEQNGASRSGHIATAT